MVLNSFLIFLFNKLMHYEIATELKTSLLQTKTNEDRLFHMTNKNNRVKRAHEPNKVSSRIPIKTNK